MGVRSVVSGTVGSILCSTLAAFDSIVLGAGLGRIGCVLIRTLLVGEDGGGLENDNFRFLLGVDGTFSGMVFIWLFSELLETRAKAGPSRFKADDEISPRMQRLGRLFVPCSPERSDRGVKNLLNDLGVTGGGFLGLIEGADGGEDGNVA